MNTTYRWFIGYDLDEKIPHFSIFDKNYSRRFQKTYLFKRILAEAIRCGFVDASPVFMDVTHIKANANKRKATNEIVEKQAKHYHAQLEEEIAKDRILHTKKPFKNKENDDSNPR